MLHVIGITIGILLLSVLLIFFLVLFVPIRYRVMFQKENEVIKGEVRFFWLFHFISGLFFYHSEGIRFRIRILGISIYDSSKPKKEKKRRRKRKNKKPEGKEEKVFIEESKDLMKTDQTVVNKQDTAAEGEEAQEKPEENEALEKASGSVRNKINGIIKKIKDILNNIKRLCRNVEALKEKAERVKELLWTDEYKEGYKKALSGVKRLLRHLRPTRLSGRLCFGADDPYITGKVFSYAGMLYGMYGKSFNLQADFEKECMEVLIKAKGRMRLFTLLASAVCLLNKKVRRAVKTIKNLSDCM